MWLIMLFGTGRGFTMCSWIQFIITRARIRPAICPTGHWTPWNDLGIGKCSPAITHGQGPVGWVKLIFCTLTVMHYCMKHLTMSLIKCTFKWHRGTFSIAILLMFLKCVLNCWFWRRMRLEWTKICCFLILNRTWITTFSQFLPHHWCR